MGRVPSGKPKGRPKQFYKYELPTGVVKVVRAQCADYERKELAIESGTLTLDVRNNYIATNEAIRTALQSIEEACRLDFLADIAENRGYDKSQVCWLFSINAYYARKRKVLYDIAKGLCLI